jgi:hypothetical protein
MSVAIPPLALYDFTACTWAALPFIHEAAGTHTETLLSCLLISTNLMH